jgi:hypothetical protein
MSVSLEGIGATPSLVLSYLSEGNANSLANGDTIAFPNTAVKTTSSITVSVSNQGTGQGTIKGILVTGPGFLATGLPAFPASIDPGKELRFTVQFAPKDAGTATGGLRIDLSDRSVSAKLQGSTADPTFAVYYALADANTRTLTDGSRLTFTPTTVNTSTTATVAIANNGAGPGDLVAVALTGAGFELQGLPAFPFSIEPTKALTLRLVFTPKQQQDYAGTLRIDFRDRSLTINVEGSAQSAVYTYESGNDQGTQPLAVGGAIAFRDAAVGQTSRAIVRIRNAGNAAGQLTTIAISGQDFQFIDAVALPLTLQPNETRQFTLGFTPSQPSSIRGQLRIGADVFDLTGTGLGSRLTYTTSAGTATTTVAESGAVIFTPARIGESSAVAFSIQNTGTADASIASINLTAPTAVYSLEDLPPMPFSLAPGATANLTIRFLPNNSGTLNATLRVNNASFTLSGAGLPPSALPDYTFQGPAGGQQPLQQPTVGLTLTAPYPLGLRGTLTLSFISDEYNANPAVQFATGGRTVAFTIPPNSTQAVFDGGKTAIGLQTGTVAGAINVTPAFATVAGYDLTPANAPALNMNISRSAPKLLDASLTSRTSTGFAITVTGFATGRSLKQLEFQLIPKSGERITNATVTVNVEGSALLWFQSAASQSFGGMFTITVPFALQGAANQDLAGKVQSVSVTASNDLGASAPANVDVSR